MSVTSNHRLAGAFGQSVQSGQTVAQAIQDGANDLAFLMQQLHGEAFTADINHEVGYLMIRWRDMGDAS
ncbi:hypothetical protein ACTOV4_16435 [Brucella sp. C7-11G]